MKSEAEWRQDITAAVAVRNKAEAQAADARARLRTEEDVKLRDKLHKTVAEADEAVAICGLTLHRLSREAVLARASQIESQEAAWTAKMEAARAKIAELQPQVDKLNAELAYHYQVLSPDAQLTMATVGIAAKTVRSNIDRDADKLLAEFGVTPAPLEAQHA